MTVCLIISKQGFHLMMQIVVVGENEHCCFMFFQYVLTVVQIIGGIVNVLFWHLLASEEFSPVFCLFCQVMLKILL